MNRRGDRRTEQFQALAQSVADAALANPAIDVAGLLGMPTIGDEVPAPAKAADSASCCYCCCCHCCCRNSGIPSPRRLLRLSCSPALRPLLLRSRCSEPLRLVAATDRARLRYARREHSAPRSCPHRVESRRPPSTHTHTHTDAHGRTHPQRAAPEPPRSKGCAGRSDTGVVACYVHAALVPGAGRIACAVDIGTPGDGQVEIDVSTAAPPRSQGATHLPPAAVAAALTSSCIQSGPGKAFQQPISAQPRTLLPDSSPHRVPRGHGKSSASSWRCRLQRPARHTWTRPRSPPACSRKSGEGSQGHRPRPSW